MGLLFDEVLDKAYETLRLVLPYDRLSVALIDDDGEMARACWARSDNPEMMLRVGFAGPLEGSSLQGIISSGEPRIINDLAAYLEQHPDSESTRLMVAEGIRSSLTCPLISTGKPIGFMFFSSRTPDTYKDAHVEIFKLIAGHLSVVLEKSNLYQQILQEKEKSDRLLLNVVPARIAARLRAGEQPVVENFPEINIFFADIVDFTEFASRFSPESVVDFLREYFRPDRSPLRQVWRREDKNDRRRIHGDQRLIRLRPATSTYATLPNLRSRRSIWLRGSATRTGSR